jgi:hypothetical protein
MATAQDLVNYCETMLQQTSQMILAGLASGGGENDQYTIPSNTQLLLWATEGQNRLARLCLPIADTATVAAAAAPVPFTQIVSASGRQLITPTTVSIGGRTLQLANQGWVGNARFYPATPAGEPAAWASTNTALTFSTFSTQPGAVVNGYFLAVPLTNPVSPVDPYIDDMAQLAVATYMAMRVAQKNQDNTVLAERIVPLGNDWVAYVREIYARLIQGDATLEGFFPPEPINSMPGVQIVKQIMPRT